MQTGRVKRRRKLLIILTGVFVTAVLAVVLWPREREPEYQGKKLSEWLRGGSQKPAVPEADIVFAVNQIGTNALPFLVKWISYDRSKPKEIALSIVAKVPGW